jgi:ABC-type amino acid transport system permease subunit
VQAATAILMGVPPIVFLFWLHYPAQALFNIVVDPFITASVAISILGIFMVADAVRAIIVDFPAQYIIAGRVCGLSQQEILIRIILPIAFRSFLPNALFIIVALFQMTLFASFISVNEIFRVAQRINSIEYRPVEVFTALALFCVAVCLPLHVLAQHLRVRYTRDLSDR